MNLIDLICNFGGLLGMWLGLSLFGILYDTYSLFTKIDFLKNMYLIKININNVYCKFILTKKRISNKINNIR